MSVWRARGFRCLEFRQFGCGDLEISYLEPTEPTFLGLTQRVQIHYHCGIRSQKTIPTMALGP